MVRAMNAQSMNEAVRQRWVFAQGLITEAGARAAGYFARVTELEVHSKGAQDVVTEADVQVELLVKGRVAEAFGGDAFLGEETGTREVAGAAGIWGIPATVNGRPIAPHRGTSVTAGIVSVGYSPRVTPDEILPVFERLLRAGGTYARNGSGALSLCYVAAGRLLGYIEPHINSWDCLGAIAVIEAAGGRVNDFLAGGGLFSGNRIVAGPVAVYDQLDEILGCAP